MAAQIDIHFTTVTQIKTFTQIIMRLEGSYDLTSEDHYVINAKSIMGIFSMDLSKKLTLIDVDGHMTTEQLKEYFKEFLLE